MGKSGMNATSIGSGLRTGNIDIIQSHISFRDPAMEAYLEGFQWLY